MSPKVTITSYSGFTTPPVVVVPAAKGGGDESKPQGGSQRPTLRLVSENG
jgi:hypothetical protein